MTRLSDLRGASYWEKKPVSIRPSDEYRVGDLVYAHDERVDDEDHWRLYFDLLKRNLRMEVMAEGRVVMAIRGTGPHPYGGTIRVMAPPPPEPTLPSLMLPETCEAEVVDEEIQLRLDEEREAIATLLPARWAKIVRARIGT
jgi:hypothetical protein